MTTTKTQVTKVTKAALQEAQSQLLTKYQLLAKGLPFCFTSTLTPQQQIELLFNLDFRKFKNDLIILIKYNTSTAINTLLSPNDYVATHYGFSKEFVVELQKLSKPLLTKNQQDYDRARRNNEYLKDLYSEYRLKLANALSCDELINVLKEFDTVTKEFDPVTKVTLK